MRERDAAPCVQCGDTIDTRQQGHAQRVTGWKVNRGSTGGANQIALAEPEPLWLCRFCLDKRRHGYSWDQPALFGEDGP